MATVEDRRFAEEQIRALTQRLQRRKIQQARYGYGADPVVDNEVEDLEFSIAEIQRQLDGPQLLPEAKAVSERYQAENMIFLMTSVQGIFTRLTKSEEKIDRIDAGQHDASAWRLNYGPRIERIEQQQQTGEGKRRFWQPVYLALWVSVVLTVAWLAWQVYR